MTSSKSRPLPPMATLTLKARMAEQARAVEIARRPPAPVRKPGPVAFVIQTLFSRSNAGQVDQVFRRKVAWRNLMRAGDRIPPDPKD
jgi:hypothetical protein